MDITYTNIFTLWVKRSHTYLVKNLLTVNFQPLRTQALISQVNHNNRAQSAQPKTGDHNDEAWWNAPRNLVEKKFEMLKEPCKMFTFMFSLKKKVSTSYTFVHWYLLQFHFTSKIYKYSTKTHENQNPSWYNISRRWVLIAEVLNIAVAHSTITPRLPHVGSKSWAQKGGLEPGWGLFLEIRKGK